MATEDDVTKPESRDQAHHVLIQPTAPEQPANPTRQTFATRSPPWYTDLQTVFMLGFLLVVLLGGGFLLIHASFTSNALEICGIIVGFLALTLAGVAIKSYSTRYV